MLFHRYWCQTIAITQYGFIHQYGCTQLSFSIARNRWDNWKEPKQSQHLSGAHQKHSSARTHRQTESPGPTRAVCDSIGTTRVISRGDVFVIYRYARDDFRRMHAHLMRWAFITVTWVKQNGCLLPTVSCIILTESTHFALLNTFFDVPWISIARLSYYFPFFCDLISQPFADQWY